MNPAYPRNWSSPIQIVTSLNEEEPPNSYAPRAILASNSEEDLIIANNAQSGSESDRLRSVDHQGVSGGGDRDQPLANLPRRRQHDLHKPIRKNRAPRKKTSISGVISTVGSFLFGEPANGRQPLLKHGENMDSTAPCWDGQTETNSQSAQTSLKCGSNSNVSCSSTKMPRTSLFCPCFSPTVSEDSDDEENNEAMSMMSISREMRQQFALRADSTRTSAYNQKVPYLPASDITERTPIVHRTVEYANYFVKDIDMVLNSPYYWGVMDRFKAEELLDGKPEGTFLLRDSAQKAFLFSVSFRRYQRTLHARIEQENHRFGFDIHDPSVFSSDRVTELIANYNDPNRCLFFEPLLTSPLKRDFVFSLQDFCRASITANFTYDQVSAYRLPRHLMSFVRDFHYIHPVRTTLHDD